MKIKSRTFFIYVFAFFMFSGITVIHDILARVMTSGESAAATDDMSPVSEPRWAEKKGEPLQVQFSSPHGEVENIIQILTVFNKPMVPLTALSERPKGIPVKVYPSAPGDFHWLGTSVLMFQPSKPLKFSTQYTVKVDKNFKSVEGHQLEKDYRWMFETPRVKVLYTVPGQGDNEARWLTPRQSVAIMFNQPIDINLLKKHLIFRSQKNKSIPVSLWHPRKVELKKRWQKPLWAVVIKPKIKLSLNTRYEVFIDRKFHGSEGTLPMKSDVILHFSTYGPLRVIRDNRHKKCWRSISIEFSNPILYKNFINNIFLKPPVKMREDTRQWMNHYSDEFYYPAYIFPGTYHVTINGSLMDKFGQKLGRNYEYDYMSADHDPFFEFKASTGIVEAKGPHIYPLRVENVASVRFRAFDVPSEYIVPLARTDKHRYHKDDI
ncbi:MAG: Ig-like domain-containing protein, partial [bacterium]